MVYILRLNFIVNFIAISYPPTKHNQLLMIYIFLTNVKGKHLCISSFVCIPLTICSQYVFIFPQCEDLTKKLAERDQQLLVAIRRFTELEELIGVNPMPKNGHHRPESHGQLSSVVNDNKTTTSNRHQTVINTNSVFENRVRRIQDIFESHIKRIYTTESHLRKDRRTHSEVKSSIEEPERKARIKRKRKSSKRVCNLSFSSDHSFTKTELTQVTSKENVTTTILIPGIKINDVIMQTPYNWEPKCIVSGENPMTSQDIPGRSGKTRELGLLKSKEKSGSSRWRSTNADSYSSETSDVINNNGAESSSSHCMEIREMSILSISPRTSYVNSSADFTDASAYSDSSSDSDKYSQKLINISFYKLLLTLSDSQRPSFSWSLTLSCRNC